MSYNIDSVDTLSLPAIEQGNDFSPPEFDWRALIAHAFPGTSTSAQREQLARTRRIAQLLAEWSSSFTPGLDTHFIRPSVVFAVASTPLTIPDALTLSLARLIYWIYSLDTTLDALDPRDDLSAVLLLRLAAAPIIEQLGVEAFERYGWNPEAGYDTDSHSVSSSSSLHRGAAREIPTRAPLLAAALRSLLDGAAHAKLALTLADGNMSSSVPIDLSNQHTLHQLARCVCALRQELRWSPARRHTRLASARSRHWQPSTDRSLWLSVTQLPTSDPALGAYLAIAERTTGVHATAALIYWVAAEPEHVWLHAQAAIQAAARVVRLANDLHGAQQDHRQGHFTALSAALPHHCLWSRWRPRGSRRRSRLIGETHPPALSARIACAAQSRGRVVRELTSAIASFALASAHLEPGTLTYYLRHMVAAALAHYTTRPHTG